MRLPPLVGYLVAGVVIGPFTPGFVADTNLAGQLAEIGVILLMFGVGLHFSIRDLLAVRAVALAGALAQIVVSVAACVGLAMLWGWSVGAGLLLGVALSVASTVVLMRVFEEKHALNSIAGRIAVGWLIVQDLAMILVLVLLPALADPGSATVPDGTAAEPATTGSLAGNLTVTLAKLVVFVALVAVVGRRLLPWFLDSAARAGSRELFTLSVLAAALGIAYGSSKLFGVSFALGAFFAGVVLSESDLSHQAAADSLPLRDAFAVLFFVSVGMLFDPSVLIREPVRVAAVVLVVLVVKSIAALAVALALRYPIRIGLMTTAGLAQIGEFSFILANLGVSVGVLPTEGRDLILAGSLLSIALNPLVFAATGPLERWLPTNLAVFARAEHASSPPFPVPDSHAPEWRDHAVIVGHGRVGAMIARALREQDLPYVVVELNRRRVDELRQHGTNVIWGDATTPLVLEAAQIARARLLVVAVPEVLQTRRIVDSARRVNPRVDAVVRTHSVVEIRNLERQGVGLVVMGERELAFSMMDYALRSLGVEEDRVRRAVQGLRVKIAGVGPDGPDDGVPPGP